MRFIKSIVFLLYIMFFISCANKYEKAVIGDYEVVKYKAVNSVKVLKIRNLKLSLYDNKKFKIDVENRKITGEWRAYDDGDRTLIEFKINDKLAEGIVVGEKTRDNRNVEWRRFILQRFRRNIISKKITRRSTCISNTPPASPSIR